MLTIDFKLKIRKHLFASLQKASHLHRKVKIISFCFTCVQIYLKKLISMNPNAFHTVIRNNKTNNYEGMKNRLVDDYNC